MLKLQARTIRLGSIGEREGHNPRADYGQQDGSFVALVDSIRAEGVLCPPLLRAADPAKMRWVVVAGHRRVAAARIAGLSELVCNCIDWVPEAEARQADLPLALIENLCRKDLDPLEKARGFKRLADQGLKQEQIASMFGVSQSHISNTLKLLGMPEEAQRVISSGAIKPAAAYEMLPLLRKNATPEQVMAVCREAATTKNTSLNIRQIVRRATGKPAPSASAQHQELVDQHQELVAWAQEHYGSVAKALQRLKELEALHA